jgi:hypothetical protein
MIHESSGLEKKGRPAADFSLVMHGNVGTIKTPQR